MYCNRCGTQNQDDAAFCVQCGNILPQAQSPPGAPAQAQPPLGAPAQAQPPLGAPAQAQASRDVLASMGQRVGSFLVDGILGIVLGQFGVGLVVTIVNWVMFRRGTTIGLKLVGARIVRENGDISGFFHTWVRGAAGVLSAIPLGLGFWWAFWDPWRQTWHDKLLRTYVLRDTPELAGRPGTSSSAAVAWFWVLVAVFVFLGILILVALAAAG